MCLKMGLEVDPVVGKSRKVFLHAEVWLGLLGSVGGAHLVLFFL